MLRPILYDSQDHCKSYDISWGRKVEIVVLQPEEKEREVTKMPGRLEIINWLWGQMKGKQEESEKKNCDLEGCLRNKNKEWEGKCMS